MCVCQGCKDSDPTMMDPDLIMTTLFACHSLQVKMCVIPTPMASARLSSVFLLGSDSSSVCDVTVTPSGPSLTWLTLGNTPLPSLLSPSLPCTAHIKVEWKLKYTTLHIFAVFKAQRVKFTHTPLLEYPLRGAPGLYMKHTFY